MFQRRHTSRVLMSVGLVIAAVLAFQASVVQASVIHDYNFAVTGTLADSVGGPTYAGTFGGTGSTVAVGTGVTLNGSGRVVLPTGANSVLPSNAASVTIDVWFTGTGDTNGVVYALGSEKGSGYANNMAQFNLKPASSGGYWSYGDLTYGGYSWNGGVSLTMQNYVSPTDAHHVSETLTQVGSGIQASIYVDDSLFGSGTLANASLSGIAYDTSGAALNNWLGKNMNTAGTELGFIGTISRFMVSASPIPEPGTLALLASGLIGLLAYAWRKRK